MPHLKLEREADKGAMTEWLWTLKPLAHCTTLEQLSRWHRLFMQHSHALYAWVCVEHNWGAKWWSSLGYPQETKYAFIYIYMHTWNMYIYIYILYRYVYNMQNFRNTWLQSGASTHATTLQILHSAGTLLLTARHQPQMPSALACRPRAMANEASPAGLFHLGHLTGYCQNCVTT